MDMQFDLMMPNRKFVPHKDGFVFLSHKLSAGTQVSVIENDSYTLGIVAFYDLLLGGKNGVNCGYWFNTSHPTKHAPNYLTIYRQRILDVPQKELFASSGTKLVLKYRPPLLRIFTLGDDMVVIGSDVRDRMKDKLEAQD